MTEVAQDDRYFFQMHGLKAEPPARLDKALAQAIQSLERSIYAESARELTPVELEVLKASEVDVEEHPGLPDPMVAYATEFAAILKTSLSTSQAAERLGVHPVRIRQMIGEGTLYAVQIEGRWRIPEFQFQGDGLVPNIGEVNAAIDRELDAVSVLRWYTWPDPELETPDKEVLSPLMWLKRGRRPASLVRMAREL